MIKAITSKDFLFTWNAPTPIDGTPTITFKTTPAITANLVHSRSSIAVSAIANDRRTLTITNSVSLERDQVRAFLKTDGDTYYAVKIVRIVGTSAILAEPLSREIDLSSQASLEFALWHYTASANDVTSISGLYQYEVNYVSDLGQLTENKIEKSVLKVTPKPFDTGLDHDELVNQFSSLADLVPRRQSDFKPQIKAALNELSLILRDKLSPSNVSEDEIFNASSFVRCHSYFTASIIYEMNLQFDASEAMRERGDELLNIALRSVDLDLNGNGIIDSDETNLEKSGGKSTDFRASFKGYNKTEYDKSFTPTRSMRH
tara:strand:+ start:420 stop:1370 length:951 start_codon:yes stop_codon:yes gene_type:complete